VSRTIVGTREEAEIALARLKVADHERRLPLGGTSARSVRAAFQLYLQAVDAGLIELSPSTKVTVRSAVSTMSSMLLGDGRAFLGRAAFPADLVVCRSNGFGGPGGRPDRRLRSAARRRRDDHGPLGIEHYERRWIVNWPDRQNLVQIGASRTQLLAW
jgi:hypothetical protein